MKISMQIPNSDRAIRRPLSGARVCLIVLCGVVLLIAGGCGPSASDVADPVAVEVGERDIHLSELQAQLDYLKGKGSAMPGDRGAFLDRYVERQVALERACELGLDRDLELRRQWENLLIGRLQRVELEAQLEALTVSSDEIESYYRSNIDRFTRPAQVRLALLFLKLSDRMSPDERVAIHTRLTEAENLAQELPADAIGFGALAMTYSEEGTSRFKGGDIGWVRAGEGRYRWPDAVIQAGFSLNGKGAISEVIESEDGLYLLKKIDEREAVVRSLDGDLSARLEASLLKEKRTAMEAELKHTWERGMEVTLHEDVITKLDFSPVSGKGETPRSLPGMP